MRNSHPSAGLRSPEEHERYQANRDSSEGGQACDVKRGLATQVQRLAQASDWRPHLWGCLRRCERERVSRPAVNA